MGVTELQLQTVECIERLEIPGAGAELRQGGRLLGLVTADGLIHTLWSPLGGSLLAVNDSLLDRPESLRDDPRGAGWIVRIRPTDLQADLPNLIES